MKKMHVKHLASRLLGTRSACNKCHHSFCSCGSYDSQVTQLDLQRTIQNGLTILFHIPYDCTIAQLDLLIDKVSGMRVYK